MDESRLWVAGSVAGLFLLGAVAGSTVGVAPPAFAATAVGARVFLALSIFLVVFLACAFALQIYRRRSRFGSRDVRLAVATAALSAWSAAFAFFGAPLAAQGGATTPEIIAFLVAAPLLAGALSAGGTAFLARGVDKYRAAHGMAHAPK